MEKLTIGEVGLIKEALTNTSIKYTYESSSLIKKDVSNVRMLENKCDGMLKLLKKLLKKFK